MDQAEKRLKKWSIPIFGGGGNKYEDAAELFEKAGNQFKIAKDWKNAGRAFQRASDCYHHSKDPLLCAAKLDEAAKNYRKVDGDGERENAAKCWNVAVEAYADEGKFDKAAKILKEMGSFHREKGESEKAAEAFKKAADFFDGENQNTSANACFLELAKVYAEEMHEYKQAWTVLEKVVKSYIAHSTMKFQVKDVIVRAMLCRFATVTQAKREEQAAECRDALGRFCDQDVHLAGTNEAELLEAICDAIEEDEPDKVSAASAKFNGVKALDDWQVEILASLKEELQTESLC